MRYNEGTLCMTDKKTEIHSDLLRWGEDLRIEDSRLDIIFFLYRLVGKDLWELGFLSRGLVGLSSSYLVTSA
jgi:hypothetical protein